MISMGGARCLRSPQRVLGDLPDYSAFVLPASTVPVGPPDDRVGAAGEGIAHDVTFDAEPGIPEGEPGGIRGLSAARQVSRKHQLVGDGTPSDALLLAAERLDAWIAASACAVLRL